MEVKKKKRLVIILIVCFVLLVSIGVAVYFIFFREKEEIVFDPNTIVTESTDTPDEKKPKEFYVPADMPKRITIPSVGINGYIQLVGKDKEGRIAVPNNVHIAGWYINSAKPGREGLSIISGHRDGVRTTGIFRNLENVKEGDNFIVEYGDGTLKEFVVLSVKIVSLEDAFDVMYERVEGVDIQLNLVTCGGTFNKEEKTYDDRVIVVSKGL